MALHHQRRIPPRSGRPRLGPDRRRHGRHGHRRRLNHPRPGKRIPAIRSRHPRTQRARRHRRGILRTTHQPHERPGRRSDPHYGPAHPRGPARHHHAPLPDHPRPGQTPRHQTGPEHDRADRIPARSTPAGPRPGRKPTGPATPYGPPSPRTRKPPATMHPPSASSTPPKATASTDKPSTGNAPHASCPPAAHSSPSPSDTCSYAADGSKSPPHCIAAYPNPHSPRRSSSKPASPSCSPPPSACPST